MTSTLWGFSCSLQRRPNGAKMLILFMAPRQCEVFVLLFDCAPRIRASGRRRNAGSNFGEVDIKICTLAWLAMHSTVVVAEERLARLQSNSGCERSRALG
jgi:hypothetical protein